MTTATAKGQKPEPRSRAQLEAAGYIVLGRAGWPRKKPCLRCGRLRVAEHPGDRLHAACHRDDAAD